VRSDFHQAGPRDFADLVPGQKAIARLWAAAEVHRLVGRRIHPDANGSQQRGPAIGFQDRQHPGIEAAVAVVERQQHGAFGQWLAALARRQDLVDGHGLVAVGAQPGQLVDQPVGAHAEEALVRIIVFDVVIGQRQESIRLPGLLGRSHGALGRRREDGDVLGAGGQGQDDQQQQACQDQAGRGVKRHDGFWVQVRMEVQKR